MLHPTQGSREETLSSYRDTSSNIAAHDTQEGIKSAKRGANSAFEGP
jgi:hypothetical protein